jgi:hypothetical protein
MAAKENIDNLAEQLSKLAKLHADGALSDEEFKAFKAELIAKTKDFAAEQEPNPRAVGPETQIHDFAKQAQSSLTQLQGWSKNNPVLALGGALIVCVVIYFLFNGLGGTPDLRVETTGTNGIMITNTGKSPIEIRSALVNGREECMGAPEQLNPHSPHAGILRVNLVSSSGAIAYCYAGAPGSVEDWTKIPRT